MDTGWAKPVMAMLSIAILTVPFEATVAQVVMLGSWLGAVRLAGAKPAALKLPSGKQPIVLWLRRDISGIGSLTTRRTDWRLALGIICALAESPVKIHALDARAHGA